MVFIQPLDLYELLVNQLAGSFAIFLFLALVAIGIWAARFKMPNIVLGGMLIIFVVFLATSSSLGEGTQLKGMLLIGGSVLALFLGNTLLKITGR